MCSDYKKLDTITIDTGFTLIVRLVTVILYDVKINSELLKLIYMKNMHAQPVCNNYNPCIDDRV